MFKKTLPSARAVGNGGALRGILPVGKYRWAWPSEFTDGFLKHLVVMIFKIMCHFVAVNCPSKKHYY